MPTAYKWQISKYKSRVGITLFPQLIAYYHYTSFLDFYYLNIEFNTVPASVGGWLAGWAAETKSRQCFSLVNFWPDLLPDSSRPPAAPVQSVPDLFL